MKKEIVIYTYKNKDIKLSVDKDTDTIWATQAEIAMLFDIDQSVASRHINNIFKDGELNQKSNMQKMHIANSDKPISLYSLDVILSVGYRTNSIRAISFRKWATSILHKHLIEGYTINKNQISQNYNSFMKSVADIQALLPEHVVLDTKTILELIKEFAGTWVSLDAYDKEKLKIVGYSKKAIKFSGEELFDAIQKLKKELLRKNEATDIFAQEREKGSVTGIVGNVMQSFGGKMLYETAEEKAAHLLYFIVKNHPFVDGNKRSGAFSFIWFLRRFKLKGSRNINTGTLTALTLLIAESNPNKKDQMIALITQLLK